ncbi:MAG TPA: DUF1385 domain-containing protein [Candidatus Nanoarchaeia archaeon]|nr:DUF1385 domain-containing protein [Candidatus Nanoarchaeia archaeon]
MFRCGEVGDWKKLKVFILDEIYNNGVEEQFAMVNAGGQAVIEGVLMRYEDRVAVAVRNPEGKIVVKKERVRWKESKLPFVRGIVNLISMLRLGVAALGFSSDVALGIKKQKKGSAALVGSFIVAIIVGIFLFKFLPLGAAELVDGALGVSSFWFNVVDGGVRFLILVAYLGAVSLMADMRRVFEYHGAEHKAVNCFEAGKMLTVKNVQSCSKVHKRCGTTFVFLVVLISIFVFVFIPKEASFGEKLGLRVLLLPVIASLSYEVLRLGAKHNILKPLILPGLWVQGLTTREPDNKQVEVAIRALKAVL